MKIVRHRNVNAEIRDLLTRKGVAIKALPEFTGKTWSKEDMLAATGFISGHWNLCLTDLDRLFAVTIPLEDAEPIRAAARASALRHLDFMRLAMDELTTELKNQQAAAAAGERQ